MTAGATAHAWKWMDEVTNRTELLPHELRFVQAARVARLATANAEGTPHVVPVCFAMLGGRVYIALDEKPKRVDPMALRRVRNLLERPEADLLVDRYSEQWSELGFVRMHCTSRIVAPDDLRHPEAVAALRERYAQYTSMDLASHPIIELTLSRVTSWGNLGELTVPPDHAGETGRGLPFLALARGRRSVRQFTAQPVERATLEALLEAARWAPSPHGRQPWRFAVLTKPGLKDTLAEAMGAEWQRNLEMDGESPEVVAARLAKSRRRVQEAPAIVITCLYLAELDVYPDAGRQVAEHTMAVQSLGAAIQNLLLAAYAAGLDTGWMCAPLFCPDVVRDALALDAALIPHALITIGYAQTDPKRRPHRPIGDLIARFD
jgi:coenzyme F420-0:L-glutamate ligase/coenzyme F420-1:gamma-L-glutamate ligase